MIVGSSPPDSSHHTNVLPTPTELRTKGFGRTSADHSFRQEAAFETTLICLFKSGVLDAADRAQLFAAHPLIKHLWDMVQRLKTLDITPLQEYNEEWAAQTSIPFNRKMRFLACLLHYNGRVGDVMRFAGNNYTGEFRNLRDRVGRIRGLVDDDLLAHYTRLMTTGAPAHFNAESTRHNALTYWRKGNHESILKNLQNVLITMNKEERNCFVIPFPSWIARFLPDIFLTPQHILQKPGKKDRQVFDGSRRYNPDSKPVNMMTSTKAGVELNCIFGDTFEKILTRIWNLRITYPQQDIIIHANDVKSCFRQIKHHPDCAGAFSYIVADNLFLCCGLTFGSDFSPASWEVCRTAEQMAQRLFADPTLAAKHAEQLSKLQWGKYLGKDATYAQAWPCKTHNGVLGEEGTPHHTPHHYFVDDGVYAEVYDRPRILRAAAASIETIFRLLSESDLRRRQDPVSWDKLLELTVTYNNIVLGQHINTRTMLVSPPDTYIAQLNKMLAHWHDGRKSFNLQEIEPLVGHLNHVARTLKWLQHLMGHLFTSLSAALGANRRHLLHTSKAFKELLRVTRQTPTSEGEELHAKEELRIIRQALADPQIMKSTPIAHLIPRTPDGVAYGDSSLDAMGGYSVDMGFWWYVRWPKTVRQRTLRNF
eukprot:CCRYP_006111-RA/>CCRYP_006111-RA protein AED:0.13 eAED:0.35 QI:0/0/0/1/0/0/2/0/649